MPAFNASSEVIKAKITDMLPLMERYNLTLGPYQPVEPLPTDLKNFTPEEFFLSLARDELRGPENQKAFAKMLLNAGFKLEYKGLEGSKRFVAEGVEDVTIEQVLKLETALRGKIKAQGNSHADELTARAAHAHAVTKLIS